MAKNPADIAAKWSRNLSAAGQAIQQGVQAVQVNPAQQAAASLDTAKANYIKAIDSGKTAAGLARTTLAGWQQAMIKKGVPRIADGAATATPKVQAFMSQLMPAIQSAQASLPPRGSDAQNEQRMLHFSRAMKQFKRTQ